MTRSSRTEESGIYSSGIQVLNPARVNALTTGQVDFYNVWDQLIREPQLLVSSVYPKNWFTDTLSDLKRLAFAERADDR